MKKLAQQKRRVPHSGESPRISDVTRNLDHGWSVADEPQCEIRASSRSTKGAISPAIPKTQRAVTAPVKTSIV